MNKVKSFICRMYSRYHIVKFKIKYPRWYEHSISIINPFRRIVLFDWNRGCIGGVEISICNIEFFIDC